MPTKTKAKPADFAASLASEVNMNPVLIRNILRAAQQHANTGSVKMSPTVSPYQDAVMKISAYLKKNRIWNASKPPAAKKAALLKYTTRVFRTTRPSSVGTAQKRVGVRDMPVPKKISPTPKKKAPRAEFAFNYKVTVGKRTFYVRTNQDLRPGKAGMRRPILSISQLTQRMQKNPETLKITDTSGKAVKSGNLQALIMRQNREAFVTGNPPRIVRI